MADIFVSYRRGDSAGHTGRLVDSLARHFGLHAVFQDVQSIAAGHRWDEVIGDGVRACRVLIVVIGRDWLAATHEGQRRIDDPQDPLRREITTGLCRDIPLIPVLVEGAQMPTPEQLPDDLKALARWQAHELSDSRWDYDTGRLMKMIERTTGLTPVVPQPQAQPRPERGRRRTVIAAGAAAAVAAVVWFAWSTPSDKEISASRSGGSTAPATRAAVDIAPAKFDGDWYDEDATHWGLRVQQDDVEINHTAPGSGTAIGYAQGKVRDRAISFEYVVMVPEEPRLNGQLVMSNDGTRLTGVLTDVANGGNTRVVLHRRAP